MVGRLVSFWDGFLAGAMLVSGCVSGSLLMKKVSQSRSLEGSNPPEGLHVYFTLEGLSKHWGGSWVLKGAGARIGEFIFSMEFKKYI